MQKRFSFSFLLFFPPRPNRCSRSAFVVVSLHTLRPTSPAIHHSFPAHFFSSVLELDQFALLFSFASALLWNLGLDDFSMTEPHVRYRKRVLRRQYSATHSNSPYPDLIEGTGKPATIIRKKPDGLICSICDGPAHGYNFDAITCESCKAFFRRNALKSDVKRKQIRQSIGRPKFFSFMPRANSNAERTTANVSLQ